MPTYTYKCPVCGKAEDYVRTISNRDKQVSCPDLLCEGMMERDIVASMATATTEAEYHTPVLSNALGVPPNQIKDAQKRFPHHEFAPDGRMILRSHAQRKRVLKELGFYDKDSYS